MAPPIAATRAPAHSRAILVAATLTSQFLGAVLFVIALLWIVPRGRLDTVSAIVLSVGAACVFAGGHAQRGSSLGLLLCGVIDTMIAYTCLSGRPAPRAFVVGPLARFWPSSVDHLQTFMLTAGVVGLVAALACVIAWPQARRVAAWSDALAWRAAGGPRE